MPPVVLITGASSGIGEALALEYARRGHHLALLARRDDRLSAVAVRVERAGGRALPIRCDVRDDASVQVAVGSAASQLGGLDIVVANAGFGVSARFERLTLDDYRRQFETNVFGVLRTVQASLPFLLRSRGRLALMGSVAGYVAAAGMSPYAMSKFAVRGLADSLREEVRPAGVSVTLISPGFVDSEIRRVGRDGVFRENAPEPVPAWLRVPTPRAARAVVRAIDRRCPEAVITAHGKAMVLLARHAPGTIRLLTRMLAPRVRKV
jgi:NAD(P)-dependent dehydrogenase (short-subunit alcohol dehydrogenase family)